MKIPERTVNFNVYDVGTNSLLCCATVDMPEITFSTDEVSGSGIMGKYESPTLGSVESLKLTLNYRVIDESMFQLLKQKKVELDLRQAIQVQDSMTGEYGSVGFTMSVLACPPHSLTLGSVEPGAKNDSKVELEVKALTIWLDGEEQLAIDKNNYILRIDGEDQLQKIKQDLGYDY